MAKEVQTYKTMIGKGQLKTLAKRLGFVSVGEMINCAVIGLIEAQGIKLNFSKGRPDAMQLVLFAPPQVQPEQQAASKPSRTKGRSNGNQI